MIKISNGDYPLIVCLGSRTNLGWLEPPFIDVIPIHITAEIRSSLNKQLTHSIERRVLNPDNMLNSWINIKKTLFINFKDIKVKINIKIILIM